MSNKSNKKKDLIVSAAIKLWQGTHDVSKVSLADIARVAGVSPTTVYNNFATREGLIEDVIKYLIQETLKKQWAIIRSSLPFPQKMQSILAAKMTTMQGMHTDLLDKFSTDSVAAKFLDDVYRVEMKPMMTTILEEGKQQGYIDPDLPVEVVMVYMDILKAGGIACGAELRQLTGDLRMMSALTRILYFGLFRKEFDFDIGKG